MVRNDVLNICFHGPKSDSNFQGETKDCLFILTDRCYACILEYTDGKVVTRAYGDMKDKNFQTSPLGKDSLFLIFFD